MSGRVELLECYGQFAGHAAIFRLRYMDDLMEAKERLLA